MIFSDSTAPHDGQQHHLRKKKSGGKKQRLTDVCVYLIDLCPIYIFVLDATASEKKYLTLALQHLSALLRSPPGPQVSQHAVVDAKQML